MKKFTRAAWIAAAVAALVVGVCWVQRSVAQAGGSAPPAASANSSGGQFKLAVILAQSDAETVFNAFRVAQYSLEAGDDVSVFLLGKGVDLDRIADPTYDVREKAEAFQAAGGKILACGTCLQMHGSSGSKLCPVSTMKDLYELVRTSDRVLTF